MYMHKQALIAAARWDRLAETYRDSSLAALYRARAAGWRAFAAAPWWTRLWRMARYTLSRSGDVDQFLHVDSFLDISHQRKAG